MFTPWPYHNFGPISNAAIYEHFGHFDHIFIVSGAPIKINANSVDVKKLYKNWTTEW